MSVRVLNRAFRIFEISNISNNMAVKVFREHFSFTHHEVFLVPYQRKLFLQVILNQLQESVVIACEY